MLTVQDTHRHAHSARPTSKQLSCVALTVLAFMATSIVGIWSHEAAAADPVRPGESFIVEFPQMRPDRRGNIAKMRVRIPDEYRSDKLVPLFVWLGGGAGTSNYGAGIRIADPKQFVLIGLPYPKGANDPHQKTMVGDFRRIWGYHKAMLSALGERVPNIDIDNISVGGFSNGAHCIDGYLKMREPSQLFKAFVMAEGGGYRSGRYSSAVAGKRVLVLWGDQSPHRSTGYRLAGKLKSAGMDVTRIQMRETKHAFPVSYQEKAHDWFLR